MSYVPAQAALAFIDIEGVRLLGPGTGFQLLDPLHSQFPCTPGYLGTVRAMASIRVDRSSSMGHNHPRSGVVVDELLG
jgi:hypothetical protein